MDDDNKSQIYDLLGGIDNLVAALHIEALPEEMQLAIVERFASVLFKRILLQVPDDRVEAVKQSLESEDIDRFTATLSESIPDVHAYVSSEIVRMAAEFRI